MTQGVEHAGRIEPGAPGASRALPAQGRSRARADSAEPEGMGHGALAVPLLPPGDGFVRVLRAFSALPARADRGPTPRDADAPVRSSDAGDRTGARSTGPEAWLGAAPRRVSEVNRLELMSPGERAPTRAIAARQAESAEPDPTPASSRAPRARSDADGAGRTRSDAAPAAAPHRTPEPGVSGRESNSQVQPVRSGGHPAESPAASAAAASARAGSGVASPASGAEGASGSVRAPAAAEPAGAGRAVVSGVRAAGAPGQAVPGAPAVVPAARHVATATRGHGGSGAGHAQTSPADTESDAFRAQIARGLAAALRSRGGVVMLRLEPQSLGPMRVRVEVDGDRVSARFEAASRAARDLLVEHSNSLRSALEARGLGVDRLEVVLSPGVHAERAGSDAGGASNHANASRSDVEPGDRESGQGRAGTDANDRAGSGAPGGHGGAPGDADAERDGQAVAWRGAPSDELGERWVMPRLDTTA